MAKVSDKLHRLPKLLQSLLGDSERWQKQTVTATFGEAPSTQDQSNCQLDLKFVSEEGNGDAQCDARRHVDEIAHQTCCNEGHKVDDAPWRA